MPKKKGHKKITNQDFTINDSANAAKPVGRVKKSTVTEPPPELSWDQLPDDDFDLVEEVDDEGVKRIVSRKKRNHSKCVDNIDDRPGLVYPEIVWYHISRFIKPDDVGHFAGINKVCYAITRSEHFWRTLYKDYCEGVCWLPKELRLENNTKLYGLRQRVIRALYYTYFPFLKNVVNQIEKLGSKPHNLVKRCCVNVWYSKKTSHWSVYFKLKKMHPLQRIQVSTSFLEELGRIDANPEEDVQVLHVTCKSVNEVPPLMGMTLSSVSITLSQGFLTQRLQLGFNTGAHNVSKNILPECSVVFDSVTNIQVFDWWLPPYPYFDNSLPMNGSEEESIPVLKKDFFS